jgi:protein phosphatase 1G
VSKFVEAHFVDELKINKNFISGNVELALEETFHKMDEMLLSANDELNQIRKKHHGGDGMSEENICHNAGCTANVLVFDDENYWVANSGDSRSALCRAGKLVVLSEDHKPESEIEKARIEKAGGMIMNGRVNGGLNLTRAIGTTQCNVGDFEYKSSTNLGYREQMITCHPDVKKVPRSPDDEYIIMGCDGIW